jgi:hypothetical protein
VTAGEGFSVQYHFKDSTFHNKPTEISMLFYPTYSAKETIDELKLEFSYPAWTPGDAQYNSDSLKAKVMDLLMFWYKGNEFVSAKVNDSTILPVKLDGNRRLWVEIKDARSVNVAIQDILSPKFKHSTGSDTAEDKKKRQVKE